MFSKKRIDSLLSRFFRMTTFRLTFLYLCLFSTLSIMVFFVVYASLAFRLQNQMDKDLMLTLKESIAIYKDSGISALQSEFDHEAALEGIGRVFFQLFSSKGKLLASSDTNQWHDCELSIPDRPVPAGDEPEYHTFFLQEPRKIEDEERIKVRSLSIRLGGGEVFRIGRLLQSEEIILESYRNTFGVALFLMIVFGGFFGFLLARRAMRGVQRVTDTATGIGRDELGRRVPLMNEGEEINALARAFNGMLERIELLLREVRQVTDDVAHELRTPITRIRGMAETTLKGADELDEYKEMAASVIEECDELVEVIATMLEIAETDSGTVALQMVSLNLYELVEEAVDLFRPLAEDKGIHIGLVCSFRPEPIMGDRRKLQRVIANLLDNGIKYTPEEGEIRISYKIEGENSIVEISDTGSGISEEDLPHVFERFYRGDKSRSTCGTGLGLSLAQSIIKAHSGDLSVLSSERGSTFMLSLPNLTKW